jgi:integrase
MRQRSGYVYHDKKEKCWIARTTITDNSGKRRNVKRRAENKTAAKEILKTLLREIDDEGYQAIEAVRRTFNHSADFYELHYLKPAEFIDGRKVAGLRDWKHVRAFLKIFREHFGNQRLREISYADIRAFRSKRLKTPTQYKRQRSITTVNRELACLRRIFNIAVRESWLIKNPFNCGDTLISAADERKRERILTASEELRLLEACEHPHRKHLRPLLICLLDTGARFSEMIQLRWRSICLNTHLITIEGLTTKTLKTRQVAITQRMHNELSALWEISRNDPNARVFGIANNVRKSFSSACKIAGIKQGNIDGLNLHSLRHTAATRLVKGQMPLHLVGRILGHSQPQTTYRYLSADAEATAQAALILESYQAESVSQDTSENAPELIN